MYDELLLKAIFPASCWVQSMKQYCHYIMNVDSRYFGWMFEKGYKILVWNSHLAHAHDVYSQAFKAYIHSTRGFPPRPFIQE